MRRQENGYCISTTRIQRSILATAISVSIAGGAQANTINVTGSCTLIEAIKTANSGLVSPGCLQQGSAGPYKLVLDNSSTHNLTLVENTTAGDNGLPSITSDITIQGNDATIQRASGGVVPAFRLFHVAHTGTLRLEDVTLKNGLVSGANQGGAIFNRGVVTLLNSTVTANSAGDAGGGIRRLSASLTLNNSTISANSANFFGGGLASYASNVSISAGSQVVGNTATRDGGGLSNSSGTTLVLSNSSVENNHAEDGGGLLNSDSEITLTDSTVTGNTATAFGGGMSNVSSSIVTLYSSSVTNNHAANGGGLQNGSASVTLNSSMVSGNSVTVHGGGLYNGTGTVTLNNSTISTNTADDRGGGLFNTTGSVVVSRSTLSANFAGNYGGGMANLDASTSITMSNCTLSGNSAGTSGGGIHNISAGVALTNCTLSGNSAPTTGGGILNTGLLTLSNSIVANTPAGSDCFNSGTITHAGVNWSEDGTCFIQTTPMGDPGLDALADNGGVTFTHALQQGSAAIDAADNAICAAAPVSNIDQRGEARPNGGRCDIGAFELKQAGGFFVIPAKNGKVLVIPSG